MKWRASNGGLHINIKALSLPSKFQSWGNRHLVTRAATIALEQRKPTRKRRCCCSVTGDMIDDNKARRPRVAACFSRPAGVRVDLSMQPTGTAAPPAPHSSTQLLTIMAIEGSSQVFEQKRLASVRGQLLPICYNTFEPAPLTVGKPYCRAFRSCALIHVPIILLPAASAVQNIQL